MKVLRRFVPIIFGILIAKWLLQADTIYFLIWWAAYFLAGLMFMPLTQKVFSRFYDKGYVFAKTIGSVIPAYIIWLLASLKLVPFDRIWVFAIYLILGIIIFYVFEGYKCFQELVKDAKLLKYIARQEFLFITCIAFWSYLRGLKPDISGKDGLEKFMDLGFVNSALDSKFMPPPDIWFAGKGINYYYFGHYVTAFMTKLTGIPSSISYNLMMATLFAFMFMLTFSLMSNVTLYWKKDKFKRAIIAGLISAMLLSLGGNLHTIAFTAVFPKIKAMGLLPENIQIRDFYWFPDATRYIGHNPDTKPPDEDKTIHEFPVYSLVVSDLHAHVINTQFVLTILALIFAFMWEMSERIKNGVDSFFWRRLKKFNILEFDIEEFPSFEVCRDKALDLLKKAPYELWLIAFLIGIFHMSNYWDFPIYTTVMMFALLYIGVMKYRDRRNTILYAVAVIFCVTVLSTAIALPFSLKLTSITNGFALVRHTSKFYQLCIVWGYQLFFAIYFMRFIFISEKRYLANSQAVQTKSISKPLNKSGTKNLNNKGNVKHSNKVPNKNNAQISKEVVQPKNMEEDGEFEFLAKLKESLKRIFEIPLSDVFVLIMCVSAIGLVIVPEIMLVRDIYGGGYERSNTMFKLTYQSFMMFAASAGYISFRVFSVKRTPKKRFWLRLLVIMFLILPMEYTYYVIPGWYGNLTKGEYFGLDGVKVYFEKKRLSDYDAANWLKSQNPDSQPVILEAFGDSYSDFGRISVVTGFPTIMGWGTHEWLWRNSNSVCDERRSEVTTVYESEDINATLQVLNKYNVKYIMLGSLERERFKMLKEDKLLKLGKVVYDKAVFKIIELPEKG